MRYLYAFSTKEIQKYILKSSKLKDMVAASELVETLCTGFLKNCLKNYSYSEESAIMAAGWAKLIFSEKDNAERFASMWPFWAGRFAPGANILQVIVGYDENEPQAISKAIEAINDKLLEKKSQIPVILPETSPLVARAPRTGLPAVDRDDKSGNFRDIETRRKRIFAKNNQNNNTDNSLLFKLTGKTFTTEEVENHWAKEISDLEDTSTGYIAVVHIDGNDMGKHNMAFLRGLSGKGSDKELGLVKALSEAITKSTLSAVQSAFAILQDDFDKSKSKLTKNGKSAEALKYGGRPIVIGGDDITIILRADLAFDFVNSYLLSFESSSRLAIKDLRTKNSNLSLPECFTACGGIAFVKTAFPFSQAYDLAESICFDTKKKAKANIQSDLVQSSFGFYKVTSSAKGSYKYFKKKELLSSDDQTKLWMGPYATVPEDMEKDYNGTLKSFNKLSKLTGIMMKAAKGSARTMIKNMYYDMQESQNLFNRIIQINNEGENRLGNDFEKALEDLTDTQTKRNKLVNEQGHTPLLEALWLSSFSKNKDSIGDERSFNANS